MSHVPRAVNRWITAAAVAAAALVLSAQLLVPPVSGLADNGDYQRVTGYAGFEHSTDVFAERYNSFLRTQYRVLPIAFFRSGYLSSETVFALAARWISPASWSGGLFDIRVLAGVHILLFLLALGALVSACRDLTPAAQAAAALLLVFFFTDIGYAGPFNSFYSQTASLLFLLLLAAVAAEAIRRGRLDGPLLGAYFLCAAGFVGSKPQEAIQGPLLALLGMRLAGVGLDVRAAPRRPVVWLALALCGFSAWYGRSTPIRLREAVLYSVVFSDLLPNSPDPAADAAELGLDPAWLKYSGSHPYMAGAPLHDPAFRVRFLASVGYGKIVRLYAHHPSRFTARLDRVSRKVWALRPSYGNLEKSDAHPERTLTRRFGAWSRLRLALFGPRALAWLALLYAANVALAVGTYRRASPRGRLLREGLLAAVLMSATAFLVSTLANAPPDLSRVFYVAEALCDLLLVADAAWLVQALARLRRAPRAAA